MIAIGLLVALGWLILRKSAARADDGMDLSPEVFAAVIEWDLKRRQAWRRTVRRAKKGAGPIPFGVPREGWYALRPTRGRVAELHVVDGDASGVWFQKTK